MHPYLRVVAMSTLLAATSLAQAQFVKGNEAVRVTADGKPVVESHPLPTGTTLPPPCPADKPGCAGGGWLMVETPNGLMECTEFYARPGTCRPSRYGSEKRARVWVVKFGGQWLQCQHPDLNSKCVSTKSLPIAAVQ